MTLMRFGHRNGLAIDLVSVTEMVWPYSSFRSPKWPEPTLRFGHRNEPSQTGRFGHRNGLALLAVSVTEMDSSITSVSVTETA